ncbi:acyl-CoA thioesterase [Palleronia caenipelagi]|uniref:Acyl-CoA thioesterase n=1 Tax=Palleronia caenipelagi TaxID=2489174 RepID=A0A547Q756_9RHOB|nr:thioesterase family protein [Palleronia caenipelagi]TRD22201.1 acyl-CoA thioesterase [Palleronia caenipelagi]
MTDRPAPGIRTDYRVFRTLGTRWNDNDIYGHINNVVFYEMFDTAVNGLLLEAGLLDPHAGADVFLVVDSGCRYHAPISHPAVITAGLRVGHLGRSAVRYEIALFDGDADLAAAEGHFVHVNVDRETHRPRPMADPLRQLFQSMTAPQR